MGGPDRLALSLGPEQYVRLEVCYGIRPDGTAHHLGLDLREGGADRLTTVISTLDTAAVNFNAVIITPNGWTSAGTNCGPGRIDFRFDDFAGPGGQDFSNISYIIFVFQTGGALTLESIETRRRLPLDLALLRWHPTTPETAKLAVHAGLVRPGRIVFFSGDEHDPGRHFLGRTDLAQIDSTRVYDCTTGVIDRLPSPEVAPGQPPADLFCCGHAQLADGRLLVAGGTESWDRGQPGDPPDPTGHHTNQHFTGLRYTWVFDPQAPQGTNPWIRAADMAKGRWYPSLVTLPDGSCLALSGHPDSNSPEHVNPLVEVFSEKPGPQGHWTTRPGTVSAAYSNYPRLHVMPNGEVFSATPMAGQCKAWDPSADVWRDVAPAPEDPDYGSHKTTSVLLPLLPPRYEPRVLLCGGRQPLLISPQTPGSRWAPTAPRRAIEGSTARKRLDGSAVILPTMDILVCGGFDEGRAMVETEAFDPVDDTWTTLGADGVAKVPRGYHSVALLMPDGRVFTAGSNDRGDWSYHNRPALPEGTPLPPLPRTTGDPGVDNRETRIEIFEPPYIGRPDRPTIAAAPEVISYGATFVVETPDAERIRQVALLRAGSATHAFDGDQRYVGLRYTRTGGQLHVRIPDKPAIAPPGTYLVFLVAQGQDGVAVPSEGRFVTLRPLRIVTTWAPQKRLTDRVTEDRPLMAVTTIGDFSTAVHTLHMVWRGFNEHFFQSRLDNGAWTAPQQVFAAPVSTHSPALGTYLRPGGGLETGLVMAWRGPGEHQGLHWALNPGDGWTAAQDFVGAGSSHRPALAQLGDPHMAWKGIDDDHRIYWSKLLPSGWQPQQVIPGVGTSQPPSLAVFQSRLYLFWKGIDDDNTFWYSWLEPDGTTWHPQNNVAFRDPASGAQMKVGSVMGPSASAWGTRLLLAWRGVADDRNIYFSLFDGEEFSPQIRKTEWGTTQGPTVCSLGDTAHMAWKGALDDATIYWSTMPFVQQAG
ncbi:galactose oxidase-like domain-containing protein [Streptomyces sp. NPDC001586]|uniref:galactose oxidase-like domain-containing protein n=1 Tax=Streptomyces sp. NPDC001586 TaxID=3154387 RepID=UPI0033164E85